MATADPLTAALSAFARTLARGYEITDVLYDLAEQVVQVLGLVSASVSLAQDGTMRHVVSLNDVASEIEVVQERLQQGPCVDAFRTEEPVTVSDLRGEPERWPELRIAALEAGVVALAGIPCHDGHQALGALNLYDTAVHRWSAAELERAQVLADMATGYLVNASRLQQARRVNEQLQRALDNRVVIEQAKGILAAHDGISVDRAFDRLRAYARSHRATIRAVADAVVNLGLRL